MIFIGRVTRLYASVRISTVNHAVAHQSHIALSLDAAHRAGTHHPLQPLKGH